MPWPVKTSVLASARAYLKSRSSDSFTAALKDFIAPLATNFSLCGSIHVIKHDDATPPALLDGAEFDLLADNAPVGGSPGAEDTFVDDCITVPVSATSPPSARASTGWWRRSPQRATTCPTRRSST